jgi:hypothetical protein
MTRALLRRLKTADAHDVLAELSTRQYIAPRKPLADALTEVAAKLGLTLASVREGAERMEVDVTRSIGRLTRAELEHLARLIHRASRHELANAETV